MYQASCEIEEGNWDIESIHPLERCHTLPSLSFGLSTMMQSTQRRGCSRGHHLAALCLKARPTLSLRSFCFPGTRKEFCDGIASLTKLDLA